MTFESKLCSAASKNGSWLCVGLDPRVQSLPEGLPSTADGVTSFCHAIIDATSDLVCAYKPNIAFFEALGDDGWKTLRRVLQTIPRDIPVILDAKRGDIGSTAENYATAYYDDLDVDAVTVSPYMGWDAVEHFAVRPDRCAFVLCLTSNASASEFQELGVDGSKLFQEVAATAQNWSGNLGLVVGATKPDELGTVRDLAPQMPFLIPGIGMQGGDLVQVVTAAKRDDGTGAVINVSRGVIAASSGADFAEKSREAALDYRDRIAQAPS
ncbi:MAG: orotidine-5'-phosphate decarboxylase [Candidatus Latescibacteria bacterium]|nr:orotidine-5'-phosphate decarboxylase [Candidatus Latescibacterota bacterium]